jgi:hypothetical protein
MVRFGEQIVGRALAAALRLWLVVCLWPTPLPWVHCHEDAAVDRPRLNAHLEEYHTHEAADARQGWHLHFAFLWQLARDESCPDQPEETPPNELPATPVSTLSAVQVAPSSTANLIVAVLDSHVGRTGVAFSNRVLGQEALPTAFLSSYGGAIAPHQLIGVYLC